MARRGWALGVGASRRSGGKVTLGSSLRILPPARSLRRPCPSHLGIMRHESATPVLSAQRSLLVGPRSTISYGGDQRTILSPAPQPFGLVAAGIRQPDESGVANLRLGEAHHDPACSSAAD